MLVHKCHRGVGTADQPAGESLHGDKADPVLPAGTDELLLFFAGQIAERELDRRVKPALCRFHRNTDLMCRQRNMPDLSLFLKFFHALVHAGAVAGPVDLCRVMELVNVDAVRLQHTEGRLKIRPERVRRLCLAFRGKNHLVPHSPESIPQLLFAVAVGARRIKIRHPALIGHPDEPHRLFPADPLDRQRAEPVLRCRDPGLSDMDLSHYALPPVLPSAICLPCRLSSRCLYILPELRALLHRLRIPVIRGIPRRDIKRLQFFRISAAEAF